LREPVVLNPHQRFRLVGIGFSNFHDHEDASSHAALLPNQASFSVSLRFADDSLTNRSIGRSLASMSALACKR
jgi:hypothetical protein